VKNTVKNACSRGIDHNAVAGLDGGANRESGPRQRTKA
jgi:hypothetical protein